MLFSLLAASFAFVFHASAAPFQNQNSSNSSIPSTVPSYVLEYAPVVYLFSSDPYRPSNIGSQLSPNTQPEVNFTIVHGAPNPATLDNLNALNSFGGGGVNVSLTSKVNIETNPTWLYGVNPDSNGRTGSAVSCAIIVNDHGSGLVDAYYMYFYAFNYGGEYVGFVVDDHVGDWEHNMVRYQDGEPQAVWYSQHDNGEAFTYDVVEKYQNGSRPVCYSANGTHANYAITGTHSHGIPDVNLPDGLINDYTNKGPLWDPTLNAYYYTYNNHTGKFAGYDSSAPVNWLYLLGMWGDEQYPASDPRQVIPFGISALAKYSSGPTGPIDKDLNRTQVCPKNGYGCIVRTVLGP